MRILLLGGYGLVGAAALRALLAAGHAVTALGRDVAAARHQWPEAAWVAQDIARLARPEDWHGLLAGQDAVVNCAGALQDSARDDVAGLQDRAMRALFAAVGDRRVVQVSALGAAADAPTLFMRSKAAADAAVPPGGVVLRPGLVLGAQAYGGSALLRAMAGLPGLLPVARPAALVQTVHVDDVAAAILAAVEGRVPPGRYDLAEATPHRLDALLPALRAWLGWPSARLVRLPDWAGRLAFRLGDGLGALGWRSPLRSTAWAELIRGVVGDPGPWRAAGGPVPRPLAETLRAVPATVQERWFARAWLLKPVVIGTLALFWLASGLVGLVSLDQARAVLTARGIAPSAATAGVLAGVVADLVLGTAVLWRRAVVPAGLGMLAVTLGYLVAGSILATDLWLDPLGPLVKPIPAAVLALVAMALAEER